MVHRLTVVSTILLTCYLVRTYAVVSIIQRVIAIQCGCGQDHVTLLPDRYMMLQLVVLLYCMHVDVLFSSMSLVVISMNDFVGVTFSSRALHMTVFLLGVRLL